MLHLVGFLQPILGVHTKGEVCFGKVDESGKMYGMKMDLQETRCLLVWS